MLMGRTHHTLIHGTTILSEQDELRIQPHYKQTRTVENHSSGMCYSTLEYIHVASEEAGLPMQHLGHLSGPHFGGPQQGCIIH